MKRKVELKKIEPNMDHRGVREEQSPLGLLPIELASAMKMKGYVDIAEYYE